MICAIPHRVHDPIGETNFRHTVCRKFVSPIGSCTRWGIAQIIERVSGTTEVSILTPPLAKVSLEVYAQFLWESRARVLIDFSPGSGGCIRAAMLMNTKCIAVAHNAAHQTALEVILKDFILGQVREGYRDPIATWACVCICFWAPLVLYLPTCKHSDASL